VVSAGRGKSYYIAPRGVTTAAGKKAYASLRSKGASKVKAAKIAHSIDDKFGGK